MKTLKNKITLLAASLLGASLVVVGTVVPAHAATTVKTNLGSVSSTYNTTVGKSVTDSYVTLSPSLGRPVYLDVYENGKWKYVQRLHVAKTYNSSFKFTVPASNTAGTKTYRLNLNPVGKYAAGSAVFKVVTKKLNTTVSGDYVSNQTVEVGTVVKHTIKVNAGTERKTQLQEYVNGKWTVIQTKTTSGSTVVYTVTKNTPVSTQYRIYVLSTSKFNSYISPVAKVVFKAKPAPAPVPAPTTPAPVTPPAPQPEPVTPAPAPVTPPAEPAPVTNPGDVKPSASNTGVPEGVTLTRHNGNLIITQDGTVIDGLDIHGTVTVKAKNVVIKNSIIRGPDDPNVKYYSLVSVNPWNSSNPESTQYSATIVDTEIFAQHPTPSTNGIYGYNFTLKNVDIHHVVDQIHIYGSNVRVESSWLHDNVFWGPEIDKSHIDGTHADNVQIQRGTNLVFLGNNQSGSTTAAYMVTQDTGSVTGLTISRNWIDGGGCSINIAGPDETIVNSKITDNRFGTNQKHLNCHIIRPLTSPIVFSGNVVDATGAPATIKRGG